MRLVGGEEIDLGAIVLRSAVGAEVMVDTSEGEGPLLATDGEIPIEKAICGRFEELVRKAVELVERCEGRDKGAMVAAAELFLGEMEVEALEVGAKLDPIEVGVDA